MKISDKQSISLDQVCLLADKPSLVSSRNDIDIDMSRIIAAPMSAIQNTEMNREFIRAGISLPLHRFHSAYDQHQAVNSALLDKADSKSTSKIWISVGLRDFQERTEINKKYLENNEVGILIDVANGYSVDVGFCLEYIVKRFPHLAETEMLMAGNINSSEGFQYLQGHGAGIIRASIGSGMACLTTKNTGYGRGTFTLLRDLTSLVYRSSAIVMDGGLKTPGDISKAFLAGAEYCMLGGYFKEAWELGSDAVFYGGASAKAKTLAGLSTDYIEGKEVSVNKDNVRPLSKIAKEIKDGLASAISYAGYTNLWNAIGNGTFEVLKY